MTCCRSADGIWAMNRRLQQELERRREPLFTIDPTSGCRSGQCDYDWIDLPGDPHAWASRPPAASRSPTGPAWRSRRVCDDSQLLRLVGFDRTATSSTRRQEPRADDIRVWASRRRSTPAHRPPEDPRRSPLRRHHQETPATRVLRAFERVQRGPGLIGAEVIYNFNAWQRRVERSSLRSASG